MNAKFVTGGAISGRTILFTDDGGEYYLPQIIPIAYPLVRVNNVLAPDTTDPVYGTASSKKGAWSIKGLAAGSYAVYLESPYPDVVYGYLEYESVETVWNSYSGTSRWWPARRTPWGTWNST